MNNEFFCCTHANGEVLVHLKSRVRVAIYRLGDDPFEPAAEKHHIYARFDGPCCAFEASEFSYEHIDILTKAALWYGRYLGVKMEIFVTDPRQASSGLDC